MKNLTIANLQQSQSATSHTTVMRRFIASIALFALLCMSSGAATVANAQSTQSIACSASPIDTDGNIYLKSGFKVISQYCTLVNSKKLTLGTNDSNNQVGNDNGKAAEMELFGNTFGDGSALWYTGGNEGTMGSSVPFNIKIYGNTFKRNAVIAFQGSFPPNSNIEVSGNTWDGNTSANSLFGALATYAIQLYDMTTQRLHANTKVRIVNNKLSVSISGQAMAVGINSPFAMSENSLFEVSNNDITCVSNSQNLPFAVGLMSTTSMTISGAGASWVMHGNRVNTRDQAMPFYIPAIDSGANRYPFNLNITSNVINMQGGGSFAIRCRGVKATGTSKVWVYNNTVETSGADARIMLTDLQISDQAVVNIKANYLRAYGGNALIAFQNTAYTNGASSLYVSENSILRVDDLAAGLPAIQFLNTVNLAGTSQISVDHNIFNANRRPAHYMIATNEAMASKSVGSKFYVCNNIHYNSVLTAFSHYLTSSIFNIMENQTVCASRTTPAPPTTTTQTTTPTTTPSTTTRRPTVEGETTVEETTTAETTFSNTDANTTSIPVITLPIFTNATNTATDPEDPEEPTAVPTASSSQPATTTTTAVFSNGAHAGHNAAVSFVAVVGCAIFGLIL